MKNFLQDIRTTFSRELKQHLAARLGESENAVGKALKGMIPMVLCQLVIQIGNGEGCNLFLPTLKPDWPGARDTQNMTEVLALLGGGPNNSGALNAGEDLLGRLFGANRLEVDSLLSAYTGVRLNSAAILLRLVATVLAAGLAQYATHQHLNASRLSEEVGDAKNHIYNWLPADLPRWPGYRQRTAVKAPHAVWAAELARPYWMLVLAAAGAMVLVFLVLGAVAPNTGRQKPAMGPPTVRVEMVQ
ncbi:hypothetical protein GCM10022409_01350 [Hymenobacter glaciei]|uniref:DUF937 domain-containing protein n=1 Tax=Hymenobacter glaciei TaxID=877209 RepID=A0ABP7T602_9BACT